MPGHIHWYHPVLCEHGKKGGGGGGGGGAASPFPRFRGNTATRKIHLIDYAILRTSC